MKRAPVDGDGVARLDHGRSASRAHRVEMFAGVGGGTPAPYREEGQVDALAEIGHAVEERGVAGEVVALRPVDDVAQGQLGAADRWTEAFVLSGDGLDPDAADLQVFPGVEFVTLLKPRRCRSAAMPVGQMIGTSGPSSLSEP